MNDGSIDLDPYIDSSHNMNNKRISLDDCFFLNSIILTSSKHDISSFLYKLHITRLCLKKDIFGSFYMQFNPIELAIFSFLVYPTEFAPFLFLVIFALLFIHTFTYIFISATHLSNFPIYFPMKYTFYHFYSLSLIFNPLCIWG